MRDRAKAKSAVDHGPTATRERATCGRRVPALAPGPDRHARAGGLHEPPHPHPPTATPPSDPGKNTRSSVTLTVIPAPQNVHNYLICKM